MLWFAYLCTLYMCMRFQNVYEYVMLEHNIIHNTSAVHRYRKFNYIFPYLIYTNLVVPWVFFLYFLFSRFADYFIKFGVFNTNFSLFKFSHFCFCVITFVYKTSWLYFNLINCYLHFSLNMCIDFVFSPSVSFYIKYSYLFSYTLFIFLLFFLVNFQIF